MSGLQAGVNDYLSKPFLKEELLARVKGQIQLHDLITVRDNNIRLQEQVLRYRDAEKKLHASRKHLAKMLDISSDCLLTINEGGEIIYANHNAVSLLCASDDDIVGRPIEVLFDAGIEEANHVLLFPFQEQLISDTTKPEYFGCKVNSFGTSDEVVTFASCL